MATGGTSTSRLPLLKVGSSGGTPDSDEVYYNLGDQIADNCETQVPVT